MYLVINPVRVSGSQLYSCPALCVQ